MPEVLVPDALWFVAAWVGGFVSITVISTLSLLGVLLIPLMNRVFFKFLLSFLVALAVGSLSGDAFLHLIPHVSQSEMRPSHLFTSVFTLPIRFTAEIPEISRTVHLF